MINPQKFGDSYDIVKREIIHGLAPADEWAVHPMYFVSRVRRPSINFLNQYKRFLGIGLVKRWSDLRREVSAVGGECRSNLFLDPDTGLTVPSRLVHHRCHANRWNKHVCVEELLAIATAQGREHKLTLVYDQSYSRKLNPDQQKERAKEKLNDLHKYDVGRRVYAAAYVSHTVFIWVSTDKSIVVNATRRLRIRSRLPVNRFVSDKHSFGALLPGPLMN